MGGGEWMRFENHKCSMERLRNWAEVQYTASERAREQQQDQEDFPTRLQRLLKLEQISLGSLDVTILKEVQKDGYRVQTLVFQSQKGVYIPANLYIPAVPGPVPAILNSHGHWTGGKQGAIVQRTAQRFVQSGYVVLCIDAWGAGERGTKQKDEYHGGHLGASLFDIGTSLLAVQLIDNWQAINLLHSLEKVDKERIGAVGASGGGNQTMWLSAFDQRIKACLPVVSVGTFRGQLLERNCVCELLPAGLTALEASDVLAAIAPRPLRIFSALRETIPAFQTGQMIIAYEHAKAAYRTLGSAAHISYQLFDDMHDFTESMEVEALHFFNEHFAWNPQSSFSGYVVEDESLKAAAQLRTANIPIETTESYVSACYHKSLRKLQQRPSIAVDDVKKRLKDMLAIQQFEVSNDLQMNKEHVGWQHLSLVIAAGHTVDLLIKFATKSEWTQIIIPAEGISSLSADALATYQASQDTVVLLNTFGIEERHTALMKTLDAELPDFHSLSRTFLWLGKTLMGHWVMEIKRVVDFLQTNGVGKIALSANREMAVAALCYQALYNGACELLLDQVPLSLFPVNPVHDSQALNMAAHIPAILTWGDISLLRALIVKSIKIDRPIDTAGNLLKDEKRAAYDKWVDQLKDKLHHGFEDN